MALTRTLCLSATDTMAILTEIGGDTAGAISIGQPNDHSRWAFKSLTQHYGIDGPAKALSRHFDDLKRRPFLAGEDGVRLSLAGGQQKCALTVLRADGQPKLGLPAPSDILAIPKHEAPSTVIIKPENPALPGIVENEAYCLKLASKIGLAVADAAVIRSADKTALIVARFDRTQRQNGTIRRLHHENFVQANSMFPGQKYEQGTSAGLSMSALLTTGNHLPPSEALKLLHQVIFKILIANTEAHAKNYSLMVTDGRTMAPLYDTSSVLLWPHVNQYHAQRLAGHKRKPEDMARHHWDQLALMQAWGRVACACGCKNWSMGW